eukprot:PRCOL_00001440-RA
MVWGTRATVVGAAVTLMLLNSAYSLVVRLSERAGTPQGGSSTGGRYPYEPASVVMAAEAAKMLLSALILWWVHRGCGSSDRVPERRRSAAAAGGDSALEGDVEDCRDRRKEKHEGLLTTPNQVAEGASGKRGGIPLLGACCDAADEDDSAPCDPKERALALDLHTLLLFGAPSLLYFVNNNVAFWCLHFLDPGSYAVLIQLKVATTAVAFRAAFGRTRPIGARRWAALLLLLLGCAASQLRTSVRETLAQPLMGYVLVLTQCTISAVASIYTEWLLKRSSQSIYLQNLQMYVYGTLFGLAALASKGLTPVDLIEGWNAAAFVSMGLLAFSGLTVSAIMKYADNLVKVFATAGSMFLTSGLSALMFSTPVYATQLAGIVVASVALYIYASSPTPTNVAPTTDLRTTSHQPLAIDAEVHAECRAQDKVSALTLSHLSVSARRMGA